MTAALVVLLLLLPAAAAAVPPPDRTGVVTPEAPFTWTGPTATGTNQTFDPITAEPCGKEVANYCDVTLISVEPGDFYTVPGRGISFATRQQQDIDLFVYESDASGALGDLVGISAGVTGNENVSILGGEGYYCSSSCTSRW
jgi:hypothetical protein